MLGGRGGWSIAVIVVTSAMVRVALRPLTGAGETLARLEAGDYAARAGRRAAGDACHRLSASTGSAKALGGLTADVRHLLERVVDAHDEERRAIAHELHDDIGLHRLALRASRWGAL